jgi:uncharacterized protein
MATLRREEPSIRRFGATALYLFGSAARNEIGPDSDIDLYIEYDLNGDFSLIEFAGLQNYLSDRFKRKIDLATRDALHPLLREQIERDSIRVI